MGLHEGTKKVLAVANHTRAAHAGDTHRFDARLRRCAIRIHVVLINEVERGGGADQRRFRDET